MEYLEETVVVLMMSLPQTCMEYLEESVEALYPLSDGISPPDVYGVP